MILNARMYAVAPAAAAAWRHLLETAAARAGLQWDWVEHASPAPIRALWERDDLGCVFMCGLPWVTWPVRPQVLAAPVPDLPRYGSRAVYVSEFFVRRDAPATTLAETFGGRLACMLPESNSGYNAPRHHLMRLAQAGPHAQARALYRPCALATTTPPAIIEAVSSGAADVGVADGYVLDLLRKHRPELLQQVRTVAVTESTPIPLLVASPRLEPSVLEPLRLALWHLHEDPACDAARATVHLARFQPADLAAYEQLARWQREADEARFPLTDLHADATGQGVAEPEPTHAADLPDRSSGKARP